MNKVKKKSGMGKFWLIVVVTIIFLGMIPDVGYDFKIDFGKNNNEVFRIISSTSTSKLDNMLIDYGDEIGVNIEIEHYGDLEIVDILNEDSEYYDAVWISNSIWLYMLENSYLVTDSKSIVINPVVMGIKKNQAESLGFVDRDVYNKDLLEAIKNEELKYIMSSVTNFLHTPDDVENGKCDEYAIM